MTMIPTVFRTLRTVPKDLEGKLVELDIRGIIETIQTTDLLKSTRILRKVLET